MLLKEDSYTGLVQALMNWIPVDSSQSSVLFAYGNIPPETEGVVDIPSCHSPATADAMSTAAQPSTSGTPPANASPPAPSKKSKKKSWFQRGFLQPDSKILQNANPNVPTVGLLLSAGDSVADIELTRAFEDLQRKLVD